jgi:hypothetical protein
MTTNTTPKAIRLLLNAAGIDTSQLDIVPSSHGVTISSLEADAAGAALIAAVHVELHRQGLDTTARSPYVLKAHNPRRRRRRR